jgi:segregation and condensation protein A
MDGVTPASDAGSGVSLPVRLPVFSGPLDLLLHLIRKNQVSIYDIPIALICDQYHESLRQMQELDLEIAGEFVWMASWLLAAKSRMLLPRPPGADEEDPRGELVERLLEYRRVKELASVLYDTDVVRRCLWPARVALRTGAETADLDWEDVDLRVLAATYVEVMQRHETMHPPPLAVPPLRFTVREKMAELYQRIVEDELVPLLRMMYSRADDEEIVVLFVAVLELVRLGGVRAEQRLPFAEIWLRRGAVSLDAGDLATEGGATDGP